MIQIAKMETFAISVPLKSPVKMASVVISTADNLIVRITDQDGNVGWGEGASAPTMTGETPESMVAAAKHMMPDLVGTAIGDLKDLHHKLDRLIYGNHGSKAAIDMALHDLLGKRTGKPLYELLGGKVRDDIPIITMVAGGDLETEIANARAQAAQGFFAFKVKVGVNPPARDLERTRAIRDAVGPDARISADANQGYSNQDALVFSEGAGQAGLDFMEQLVMGDDLAGMAACAKASNVPLGADEGFHAMRDILAHHECGAARGGSLKTIKLGGLWPVVEAARRMDQLGMSVNLAGKVADTSIASSAIAHLALALPQVNWDASVTNQYLADDVIVEPLRIVEGRMRPLDGPGLGIVVDESKLAKYKTIG